MSEPEERDRWSGRWTFILGTIGFAVGLGNFWRFPGLTYKYGGFGNFCVPYLIALFFFGIPIGLMELGLGQKFQRGDVTVFRNIHKRLAGAGVTSVLSAFIIDLYYTVIIGWAVVYFCASFSNPLPWSSVNDANFRANCAKVYWREMISDIQAVDGAWALPTDGACATDDDFKGFLFSELGTCAASAPAVTIAGWSSSFAANWEGTCPTAEQKEEDGFSWDNADPNTGTVWPYSCRAPTRAEEYLNVQVTGLYDPDTCTAYSDGDKSVFSVRAMFASLFVWLCIFGAIYNGVNSSSWVVWFTVPIPCLFILVMLFHGLTLDGSGQGIKDYLSGRQEVRDEIELGKMWADAMAQIFFSIGVCMGSLTSYGSYNPIKKPIIADTFIIALGNSLVSFVSGFAVWGIVGYMKQTTGQDPATGGTSLVFVTYPQALDTISAPNFWAILLSFTLFTLGLDSAFGIMEAVTTVLYDAIDPAKRPSRAMITGICCVVGFLLSLLFCTNWGYTLLDTVDHYCAVYLLLLTGIFECLGVGWLFDYERTAALGDKHWRSWQINTIGYWFCLFVIGVVTIAVEKPAIGLIAFVVVEIVILLPLSYYFADTTLQDWYDNVCMCGVKRIGYSMSKLGRLDQEDPMAMLWYEPYFVFYFGICIKYIIPFVLWFLLLQSIQGDIQNGYGGYSAGWQIAGLVIPILGIITFFSMTVCCLQEVNLDEKEFSETFTEDEIAEYKKEKEASSAVGPEPKGDVELAKVQI